MTFVGDGHYKMVKKFWLNSDAHFAYFCRIFATPLVGECAQMTLMKWSRKWKKVISHFSDILLCTNAPRNFDRCKDVPSYKIAYRVRNMIAMPKGKFGDKARWIYYITLPSQKYFIVLAWNRSFTLTAYHFCTRFVVSVPMRALEQFALPKQNLLSSLIFWR